MVGSVAGRSGAHGGPVWACVRKTGKAVLWGGHVAAEAPSASKYVGALAVWQIAIEKAQSRPKVDAKSTQSQPKIDIWELRRHSSVVLDAESKKT